MCYVFSAIFLFLENFQKPPGRLVIAAKQLILILVFPRFVRGIAWQWVMCCQVTQGHNPVFGFFLMKCLSVMNTSHHRQSAQTYSLEFDVLRVLEWCWLEGKEVLIICGWLGFIHHWIPCDWRLIGMKIVWAWS